MTAAMPFHKFKQLVKQHGCYVERRTKEWQVVDAKGNRVVGFAVTHGKQEVKPVYVQMFLAKMGAK